MFGKFKLTGFLLALAGLVMTLSAGNDVTIPSGQTLTIPTRPSQQRETSSASQPPPSQRHQTVSQNNAPAKTAATGTQAHRENYKPISLTEVADATVLVGNDPKAVAIAAFSKAELEGGSREVTVDYPQPDRAVVTITQLGLADDSVRGIKYRAELVPTAASVQTDKQWEIVWVGSQVTCQPERGHQHWSTELCL